jgi:Calcineurin-like phosphoesterase
MKIRKILICVFLLTCLALNFGYMFFPLAANAEKENNRAANAEKENNSSGFNFVSAGDWGCGNRAKGIFSMMKKMEPELYLGLGDYSYEPSMYCWFDTVKEAGPLLKVVVGNHDVEGSLLKQLMNKFHLDSQYYSFDYRNVHFLALSTELEPDEYDDQFQFASEDLANARLDKKIDWIIVFQHRPLYSGSGLEILEFREPYHHLFEKYHVDLVLTGHAHNYERSYPILYNENKPSRPTITDHEVKQYFDPQGTIFVIAGTGGKSIQFVEPKPFLTKIYEGYGCINVQIEGKQLRAEFYSDDGKTIDEFSIIKDKTDFNEFDSEDGIHQVSYDQNLKKKY